MSTVEEYILHKVPDDLHNPTEDFLRMDRIPHIWCPGCGIGTTVNCLTQAIAKCEIPMDNLAVVSGIGCTGRVAGYMNIDSFHTTHGRPIAFATGLKMCRPKMNVIVVSGEGDLTAIGGNHFIHAARRNMDMLVICDNNFNYAMTGGQASPTTPETAKGTTAPYGVYEYPFNLPFLADSCGAVYVARWTAFHVRQITKSITEALKKPGFRFIEIITPCPTLYERRNKLGDGLTRMKWFKENSVTNHKADTRDIDLGYQEKIICGRFVDRERKPFAEAMEAQFSRTLGDKFVPYDEEKCREL
jgi:2-oxoglutarate/2-oxoacid ferredoxin oxidoreductase subunit beta